ncbi:MAG: O-antigen ligase family protein [Dethiobacter sp.]|nr:O-antigen ligase family protein [Dethiobacter sp.]
MPRLAPKAASNSASRPLLNLDFRPLVLLGLAVLLFFPPFLRGLFFAPELLLTHQLAAAVFLVFVLDRVIKREPVTFSHPLDWLLLGLFVAYLVSLSVAVNMRGAVGEVLKYLNYLLVYFMVSRSALNERTINYFLHIIFAGAVGVAAVGLFSATGHLNFPGAWAGTHINSTLQYRNALAGYLVAAQVVGFTLWVRAKNPLHQTLLAVGSLLALTVLLLSQSRGGWVVYPLAVAVWLAGLRGNFWRGCYLFFLNLGLAMLTARFFLPDVLAGDGTGAVRVLLVACGAMVAAQLLIALGDSLLARRDLEQPYRSLLNYGGLLYMAAVVGVYLFYAVQALPRVGAQFLPAALLDRAGAISLEDPSAVSRFIFFRDALEIIRSHPLLGAGGGAWNALYHRYREGIYFTTEVHSSFLQTWVETGTVGFLLFTGFWFMLAYLLWRLAVGPAGPNYPLVWGSGVAALALVGHSAIDFTLSLPALALLVWALAGIARGGAAGTKHHAGRFWSETGKAFKFRPWLQLTVGLLLVLALWLPSWRLYRAGVLGAEGARALNAQQLTEARGLMEEAHRLDPFTGTYLADLAQVEAALGLANEDPAALQRAVEYAEEAVRMEPFNPRVRVTTSLAYLLAGHLDQAVAEAHALITINPTDVGAYEFFGRSAMAVAKHYLLRREYPMARTYLERVAQLPARVEARAREIPSDRFGQRPRKLEVTPLLSLSAGQAASLLGDYPTAKRLLITAANQKELAAEAALWQAVTAARNNNRAGVEKYLARARIENQAADAVFKEIMQTPTFR